MSTILLYSRNRQRELLFASSEHQLVILNSTFTLAPS